MGLPAEVKRLFASIMPMVNRGGAGIFVDTIPTGAGLLGAAAKTLTGKATALNYGAVGGLLAATANTTECWVEGIVACNPQVANKDYYIAITNAAAITAVAQIAAEVAWHANLVTDVKYIPLGQRVYMPAGVVINAALAASTGGKTCDVWAIISRNK